MIQGMTIKRRESRHSKRCPYDHRERLQTGSTFAVIQGMTMKTRESRHGKEMP